MKEENPLCILLSEHVPLPLNAVSAEHFAPALDEALARARSAIDRITDQPGEATFENTVVPLEAADEGIDRISSVFYHLLHVQTDEHLQKLSTELPPRISAYANDVMLNADLFKRLEAVESNPGDLSPEQQTVLTDLLSSLRRNGASLSPADQELLRKIDEELSICAPKFAENVLKATQSYALWLDDADLVSALPESARNTAKEAARKEGRDTEWKFTLDAPSYLAVMTYLPDADLRREVWTAYASRCVEGDLQNQDLIRSIVTLRDRRARLLGYEHHAHYVLERRMVGSLENLRQFYDRLIPVVMPAARADLEALRSCNKKQSGDPELHPWDVAYTTEQLRQQQFDLRQEELRPWFSFESTLQMVFTLAGTLFDLQFEDDPDLPVYMEGLSTYKVSRKSDGSLLGQLLIDPFPRSTKRPGAWMNALIGQGLWSGVVRRPVVAIVANFTPPSEQSPSLLTMDEARTLFHEFGHALHELLSQCTYRSVAGTRVRWDFVELPSQLLENWLLEPEFLRTFPRHVHSGEPLPEELIQKIQDSRTFMKGFQSARQLAFGKLDLAWHTTPPDRLGEDLKAFEHQAMKEVQLFPPVPGTALSPSFQHIFSGGYAAGYYSYKWAEVLEADVFELFQEKGLFDPQTAQHLVETLLSKGGSAPPEVLFHNFRGRAPDPDALLRRDGLLTA